MEERRKSVPATIEVTQPNITVRDSSGGGFMHRYGPVIAYAIVVAVLSFNLKLQADTLNTIQATAKNNAEKAELSACEVLDHRVSARLSFIQIIVTLKGIALAAADGDPSDKQFAKAAEGIKVPESPSPNLIEERDRVCAEAGIRPEQADSMAPGAAGSETFDYVLISARKSPRCLKRRVTIVGTSGFDIVSGTGGRDVIHGRGGNDIVFGLEQNDRICGGGGDDNLSGDEGWDRVDGGRGRDTCEAERKRKCES